MITRPRLARVFRTGLGLSLLAALVSVTACSDDEERSDPTECRSVSGTSSISAECSAGSGAPARRSAAEVFRSHVVVSSSAAGIALNFVDGAVGWFMSCVVDAVGRGLVSAITGSDAGAPTCGQWDRSASYAFDNGTYSLDLRQQLTFYAASIKDAENSATLRFTFAKAIGAHAEGAVVPFDLGRADTFLVGVRVVTTASGGVALAYDRPGPLVELLGLGPTPPNPLPLTDASSSAMQDSLRSALAVEGATRADLGDCDHRSVIELAFDRTRLTEDFRPRLLNGNTRPEGATAPSAVAVSWNVVYPASNPATPTGNVEADFPSDTLATRATVRFTGDDPTKTSLEVGCAAR